jgi:hypothetical protein
MSRLPWIGLLLVALVALWWGTRREPTSRAGSEVAEPAVAESVAETEVPVAGAATLVPTAREALSVQPQVPTASVSPVPSGDLRLTLSVGDRQGAPVLGVRVDVVGWIHAGRVALDFGLTDARCQGSGEWALARSAETLSSVEVRVAAEGFHPQSRTAPLGEDVLRFDFVLERGSSLAGRLLDGRGQPLVAQARLRLDSQSGGHSLIVPPAVDGCFELPFEGHGSYQLTAEAQGIGRLQPRAVTVVEGVRNDLGDLQLLGEGVIAGRVVLGDGTELPEDLRLDSPALVTVVAEPEPPGPGLRRGQSFVGSGGRFELRGLAIGDYQLQLTGSVGRDETRHAVRAGDQDLRIAADWLWLLFRPAAVEDGAAELVSFEIETSRRGRGNQRTITQLPAGTLQYQALVPAGHEYMVRAVDSRGVNSVQVLSAELPSGRHEIVLEGHDEALSSVVVRVLGAALPRGANFSASWRTADGRQHFDDFGTTAHFLAGQGVERRLTGLTPGPGDLVVSLAGAGLARLENKASSLVLAPGGEGEVVFETVVGCGIELEVGVRGDAPGGELFAEISYRRAGEPEFGPLRFEQVRDRSVHSGNDVQIGGPRAILVEPLAPGNGLLRIEAPGYLPQELVLDSRAGHVESLTVELEAAP